MTYPRAHLVDADNGGVYHCISRCVRRSWLCGDDPVSGQCFEHRRAWLESRLLELAGSFAIDLYGYAVMSNHYHVVLEIAPQRTAQWSDEEVARRWSSLHPGRSAEEAQRRTQSLLGDPTRLALARERLGSLSWFMRYINEPLARLANREDAVKGRFWEGRFKSIALLDEAAIIACMAYVDLNPLRANTAQRVEDAAHTSIARRLASPDGQAKPLIPLATLGMTLGDYRSLLAWTVSIDAGDVSAPAPETLTVLSRMGQDPVAWLGRVKAHRFKYRAYGALDLLRGYSQRLRQRWLWGAKPGFAAPDQPNAVGDRDSTN